MIIFLFKPSIMKLLIVLSILLMPVHAFAREIPMWKGIKKSPSMLAADKAFIASIEQTTTKKNGAKRAEELGWKFIFKKKPDMAIKRFNQAWPLNPDSGRTYWGFAIAVHYQGRPNSEVMNYFKMAERRFSRDKHALSALYSDMGQVFGERKQFKRSIKAFEKSLRFDRNNSKSRRGIKISARAIGDQKTLEKYR